MAFQLLVGPALAAEATQQFTKGEPVILRRDAAYVLMRTNLVDGDYIMDPILVRVLSASELRDAIERRQKDSRVQEEPNVVRVHDEDDYGRAPDGRTFFLAISPGSYVLAGIATSGGAGDVCMCMGTVKFDAKPGVITDMGLILMARDDEPTTIPELTARVRGRDLGVEPRLLVMGLRPYSPDMLVPGSLSQLPRTLADYRVASRFPNYFGAATDRLAPVAGVLDYDKDGRVLDLKDASAPVSHVP
jgi:hypothetical protein